MSLIGLETKKNNGEISEQDYNFYKEIATMSDKDWNNYEMQLEKEKKQGKITEEQIKGIEYLRENLSTDDWRTIENLDKANTKAGLSAGKSIVNYYIYKNVGKSISQMRTSSPDGLLSFNTTALSTGIENTGSAFSGNTTYLLPEAQRMALKIGFGGAMGSTNMLTDVGIEAISEGKSLPQAFKDLGGTKALVDSFKRGALTAAAYEGVGKIQSMLRGNINPYTARTKVYVVQHEDGRVTMEANEPTNPQANYREVSIDHPKDMTLEQAMNSKNWKIDQDTATILELNKQERNNNINEVEKFTDDGDVIDMELDPVTGKYRMTGTAHASAPKSGSNMYEVSIPKNYVSEVNNTDSLNKSSIYTNFFVATNANLSNASVNTLSKISNPNNILNNIAESSPAASILNFKLPKFEIGKNKYTEALNTSKGQQIEYWDGYVPKEEIERQFKKVDILSDKKYKKTGAPEYMPGFCTSNGDKVINGSALEYYPNIINHEVNHSVGSLIRDNSIINAQNKDRGMNECATELFSLESQGIRYYDGPTEYASGVRALREIKRAVDKVVQEIPGYENMDLLKLSYTDKTTVKGSDGKIINTKELFDNALDEIMEQPGYAENLREIMNVADGGFYQDVNENEKEAARNSLWIKAGEVGKKVFGESGNTEKLTSEMLPDVFKDSTEQVTTSTLSNNSTSQLLNNENNIDNIDRQQRFMERWTKYFEQRKVNYEKANEEIRTAKEFDLMEGEQGAIRKVHLEDIKDKPYSQIDLQLLQSRERIGRYGHDQNATHELLYFEAIDGMEVKPRSEEYDLYTQRGVSLKKEYRPEYYVLKDYLSNKYGMSDGDIEKTISMMNGSDDGLCSLAAAYNSLQQLYGKDAEEYYRATGYRLQDNNIVNDSKKLVDLFIYLNSEEQQGSFFKKEDGRVVLDENAITIDKNGMATIKEENRQHNLSGLWKPKGVELGGYVSEYDVKSLNGFLKANGGEGKLEATKVRFSPDTYIDTVKQIQDNLEKGDAYTIQVNDPIVMINIDAVQPRNVSNHAMAITGITEQGIIVSSWNKRFIIPHKIAKEGKGFYIEHLYKANQNVQNPLYNSKNENIVNEKAKDSMPMNLQFFANKNNSATVFIGSAGVKTVDWAIIETLKKQGLPITQQNINRYRDEVKKGNIQVITNTNGARNWLEQYNKTEIKTIDDAKRFTYMSKNWGMSYNEFERIVDQELANGNLNCITADNGAREVVRNTLYQNQKKYYVYNDYNDITNQVESMDMQSSSAINKILWDIYKYIDNGSVNGNQKFFDYMLYNTNPHTQKELQKVAKYDTFLKRLTLKETQSIYAYTAGSSTIQAYVGTHGTFIGKDGKQVCDNWGSPLPNAQSTPHLATKQQILNTIKGIDSGLEKGRVLKKNEEFYSGVSFDKLKQWGIVNKDGALGYAQLKTMVGKVATIQNYISTGLSQDTAFDHYPIMLKIRCDAGKNYGAYINEISHFHDSQNEVEFLLKRGGQLKFEKVYKAPYKGQDVIYIESSVVGFNPEKLY